MLDSPLTTRTAPARRPQGGGAASAGIVASVDRATKVYPGAGGRRALDDVSVGVPAGRLTAVVGPSGAGKTTLLLCLAGLEAPTSGRVTVGGVDLAGMTDGELTEVHREQVAFVCGTPNLLPSLSAAENIRLPCTLSGRRPDPGWFGAVVAAAGLADRLGDRPGELSGGLHQRVAVARALVTRPAVVVADEPGAGLGARTAAEVLCLLRRVVDDLGQAVVVATRDPVAAAQADSAVVLAAGRLVAHVPAPSSGRLAAYLGAIGGPNRE
jgi:putative ABC transport system ATP-binding protein